VKSVRTMTLIKMKKKHASYFHNLRKKYFSYYIRYLKKYFFYTIFNIIII